MTDSICLHNLLMSYIVLLYNSFLTYHVIRYFHESKGSENLFHCSSKHCTIFLFVIYLQLNDFMILLYLLCKHSELGAAIKWKYHVPLTGIQIENHSNLLTSVCINSWENTAYVTNPLSDCVGNLCTSQYLPSL